jgi:hypothetical protein
MENDIKKQEEIIGNIVDMLLNFVRPTLERSIKGIFFPAVYKPIPYPMQSRHITAVPTPIKKATIKFNSMVVQNVLPKCWNARDFAGKLDTVFEVRSYQDSDNTKEVIKRLEADGFGSAKGNPSDYGDGPIFSLEENLNYIKESNDSI